MSHALCRAFSAMLVDEVTFNVQYRPSLDARFGAGIMGDAPGADRSYLLLQKPDGAVVAAAKLFPDKASLYLAYIEVAHDARGQGHGRQLYKALFAHAARNAIPSLVLSQYTRDGRQYLLPLEKRLARRYAPYLKVTHEYYC